MGGDHRTWQLALLFLLALSLATPVVALQISAPATIAEGLPLELSASGAGIIQIRVDKILVASGQGAAHATIYTGPGDAGARSVVFSSDVEGNQTRSVTIVHRDPVLELISPQDVATQRPVPIRVAMNWTNATCSARWDASEFALPSLGGGIHGADVATAEGVHSLTASCQVGTRNVSVSRSILVDTIAPHVQSAGPSGEISGEYATLFVQTDELATCRYGLADAAYANLPDTLGSTLALRSEKTIGVQDGVHTYYVRCADVNGNAMGSSQVIGFTSRTIPTATIELTEAEQPLPAGTHAIRLTTNVPLKETPTLRYRFQESGTTQDIGLDGKDTQWSGFIVIPKGTTDSVLTFSFSGTSIQDVKGDRIERGAVFTVDAVPPAQITDLSAGNSSGGIELTWHGPEDDDGLAYNIYRSPTPEVSEADLLTTTTSQRFFDPLPAGTTFSYRVAAIDSAGNIAPLSNELSATVSGEVLLAPDPFLLGRIDDTILALKSARIDINKTIDDLEREPDAQKSQIIERMHLLDDVREARLKLDSQADLLSDLRSRRPSADEVDAAIAAARNAMDHAREVSIVKIVPQGQTQVEQYLDSASIERHLPYLLGGRELSKDDRSAYLSESIALNERARVQLDAMAFTLYDKKGGSSDHTFVHKTVSLDDPANRITILESIPKDVAQDAQEIAFSERPTILESDPIVQYTQDVLSQKSFDYVLDGLIPLDAVKKTRTLLYPAPPKEEAVSTSAQSSSPTGMLVAFSDIDSQNVLVGVGILVILGLLGYYAMLSKETPARPAQRRLAPKRIVARPLVAAAPRVPLPAVSEPVPSGTLLERAEAAIDGKEYALALSLYKDAIRDGLEGTDVEKSHRCYAKLQLYRSMELAHFARERGDFAKLEETLKDVHERSLALQEELTPLVKDAKDSYLRLVADINRHKLEELSRY